jgi:mannose-1-phosphate guanylyltransferase
MSITNNDYAVVMAGGVGSRFWPTSRSSFPKQFQDLTGSGSSLLQQTVARLEGLIPNNQILVLTHADYQNLVKEQLPWIKETQIICEPALRNTAPCLLYAALKIHSSNPKAAMVVLPSDHYIGSRKDFQEDLIQAFSHVYQHNDLLTFGIPPSSPHTGYGYLAVKDEKSMMSPLLKFTEKPSRERAEGFLKAGSYFWNSGIFVWSCKTILEAFNFLKSEYEKAENISIDYAILEKANNIQAIKASFLWNDLGTWSSIHDQLSENKEQNKMIKGSLIQQSSTGNMISAAKDKLVVIKGLKDFVVIDEDDVLLIYPKGDDQSVKELRDLAVDKKGSQLL